MKAVIIAAGKGKRLKHYTETLPKCMLKVGDKTILEWQIAVLRSSGINDISVIRGYQADRINLSDCKYYFNERYEFNNILNSLMCAKNEIESDTIISYSDILYERKVVAQFLCSSHEISVVADVDWKKQYEGRDEHPISEAENVFWGEGNRLIEIGKKMDRKAEATGEFIGMIKLSGQGADKFKKLYEQAKRLFWGKPFISANTFENAYLTDMIQYLINEGEDVYGVAIEGGWREIDTVADYEKACRDASEKDFLSVS